jgi:hypothetical protein
MLPLHCTLKVDESAEKLQGANGAACMARNARKVINAHREFVFGSKRTSEPRGSLLFLKLSTTHTLLHANLT